MKHTKLTQAVQRGDFHFFAKNISMVQSMTQKELREFIEVCRFESPKYKDNLLRHYPEFHSMFLAPVDKIIFQVDQITPERIENFKKNSPSQYQNMLEMTLHRSLFTRSESALLSFVEQYLPSDENRINVYEHKRNYGKILETLKEMSKNCTSEPILKYFQQNTYCLKEPGFLDFMVSELGWDKLARVESLELYDFNMVKIILDYAAEHQHSIEILKEKIRGSSNTELYEVYLEKQQLSTIETQTKKSVMKI